MIWRFNIFSIVIQIPTVLFHMYFLTFEGMYFLWLCSFQKRIIEIVRRLNSENPAEVQTLQGVGPKTANQIMVIRYSNDLITRLVWLSNGYNPDLQPKPLNSWHISSKMVWFSNGVFYRTQIRFWNLKSGLFRWSYAQKLDLPQYFRNLDMNRRSCGRLRLV